MVLARVFSANIEGMSGVRFHTFTLTQSPDIEVEGVWCEVL